MFLRDRNVAIFDQIDFLGGWQLLEFVHFAHWWKVLKHCKIGNPTKRARMDANLVGDLGNIEHISYVQLHHYITNGRCAGRLQSCRCTNTKDEKG